MWIYIETEEEKKSTEFCHIHHLVVMDRIIEKNFSCWKIFYIGGSIRLDIEVI